MTKPNQTVVRQSFQEAKVAEADGVFGKRLKQCDGQRLVLRANHADGGNGAIGQSPFRSQLIRIWLNRELRLRGIGRSEQDAGVQRNQSLRCRQQWVDVDFLNVREIGQQLAES